MRIVTTENLAGHRVAQVKGQEVQVYFDPRTGERRSGGARRG